MRRQSRMLYPQVKTTNLKKSIGALIKYSLKYAVLFIFAISIAFISTILSLIGPNKLKEMTNIIEEGIITGINLEAIRNIGFFLILIYSLSAIFSYLQGFIMATITQRLSKNLRSDIAAKINKLPLKYFDNTTYGDVLSRVTNDVDTISMTLNQSVVSLVTAFTMFFGSLVMMLFINWRMALVAVASTIIGFVLMSIIMSRSQKFFIKQQKDLGAINGHIEEIYSGHNIIKAYNGEQAAIAKFSEINDSLYESAWKSQFFSGLMMPIMHFIGNFGYVAVSVVGAVLVMNNMTSFGVIVAFMFYIRYFTNPLSQIAQAATRLQSAAAASDRVFSFLNEEELEDESAKTKVLKNVKGDIEFQNIHFGYTKDKEVIHNFSLKAKAGDKIAIVGPTGAGKTTLVNLLMRFYEVNAGDIKIDGISIKEITRENVHELFSMVLQDTWLFEGTIKENIVYSKKGVTDEEIIKSCKIVGIDHFIRTLPKGYDTVLNDKANLSQGQKQLITIARAMVQNSPLLILDEATSSVDTRTEILIQEAMDKLMAGRTSFIIAHRLSTIRNADLILVMNEGQIVESGKHEELMLKNGFYAQLYNSQFEV